MSTFLLSYSIHKSSSLLQPCKENLKEENKNGFLKKHTLNFIEKQNPDDNDIFTKSCVSARRKKKNK